MKNLKHIHIGYILIACLMLSSVNRLLSNNLSQNLPKEITPSLKTVNISAAISHAELQEILAKTKEDLEERILFLNRPDAHEIRKILENKLAVLTIQQNEVEGFTNNLQTLEIFHSKKQKYTPLFICFTGATVAAWLFIIALTIYDHENGFTLPQQNTVLRNIGMIHKKMQAIFT